MNLVTAAKMMALLEQMPHEGPEDDAYFIIHRLLKTELRKGNYVSVLQEARRVQEARREFLEATREEVLMWIIDKVSAMKMYRNRTGSSLYEAKKQLEAGELQLSQELASDQGKAGVTSCG
jgi:ribosomal protein L7/L12